MKRQVRWVSLVCLGAAVAVGAIVCLGDQPEDTTTNVGALSLGAAPPGKNMTQLAAAPTNLESTET